MEGQQWKDFQAKLRQSGANSVYSTREMLVREFVVQERHRQSDDDDIASRGSGVVVPRRSSDISIKAPMMTKGNISSYARSRDSLATQANGWSSFSQMVSVNMESTTKQRLANQRQQDFDSMVCVAMGKPKAEQHQVKKERTRRRNSISFGTSPDMVPNRPMMQRSSMIDFRGCRGKGRPRSASLGEEFSDSLYAEECVIDAQTGALTNMNSIHACLVSATSEKNVAAEDGVKVDDAEGGSMWSKFAPLLVRRVSSVLTSSISSNDAKVSEIAVDDEIKTFAVSEEDVLVDFPPMGRRRSSSVPKVIATPKNVHERDSFWIRKESIARRRASTGNLPAANLPTSMEIEMKTFPITVDVHKPDEMQTHGDDITHQSYEEYGTNDQDEESTCWIPSGDEIIDNFEYLVDYSRDHEHVE